MTRHDLPHRDPRPHIVKSRPIDDVQSVIEWGAAHWFCQACGRDGPQTRHHIIGGRGGRSDEPCNLLSLCWEPCHMLAEGLDVQKPQHLRITYHDTMLPKITLAIAISMKRRAGELDDIGLARLAILHGRNLPDPAPIPDWFQEQFRRNRPELANVYHDGRR